MLNFVYIAIIFIALICAMLFPIIFLIGLSPDVQILFASLGFALAVISSTAKRVVSNSG